MALKTIFEPLRIGPVTVKNRIFRSAHGTWFGDGSATDRLINYHLARAEDGVGLSFLEVFSVHPSVYSRLQLWHPEIERSYEKLVSKVAPHGMALFQQLWHGGHNYIPVAADANPLYVDPPWGPSDVPGVSLGVPPIPMTQWMIDEVVEGYAKSAAMCERTGLQGAEVHVAHGYLPQQFLSPNANKRTDKYGGSLENRARFLMEVMRAVKAAVSPNFALGVRLGPDLLVNGVDVAENQAVIDMLQAENLIDFTNFSMGSYHRFPKIMGGMHEPVGYELPTSEAMAQRSKVVSMAIGRFRTLEEAEQALNDGPIDMIGFTRAMIADPRLITKTLAGEAERVRPCIACNQGCNGQLALLGRMGCAVNVAVGMEAELSEDLVTRSDTPKKVVIVGAGPAGLEAARLAAMRGHKVVLFEAGREAGGMMNFAAKCPSRHGIRDIIVWLEAEVYALGVDVRMNSYAEAEDILAEAPDAVIVATGSYPRMDGIVLSDPGEPIGNFAAANPLSSIEALMETARLDGKGAVVVDDAGHWEALGVAEHFINLGAEVHFVSRHVIFAHHAIFTGQTDDALTRMNREGKFHLHMQSRVVSVDDGIARIVPTYGGSQLDVAADRLAFISVNRANRDLVEELRGRVADLKVVGDASAPRYLETSIREGHMAGRTL